MATLKCKMCGGDLQLIEDSTICECEYCGSKQTVPVADNEKKMNLFARANRLRFNCEFDKAAGIYESIIGEFPEEPEAYWGLLLCKYGIEYVDDPATGKKIPTCHRSSFESVMEDENLELATEYADLLAKRLYREEAKQIEELRKGIIEVSASEEPYDIFICYKETDENGDRTLDSVIAQDIYNELTEKGYRVFFSRITLEDKLGQEYEPYIFAALHSAKVMLAVGTQFEYYDAVWVKNEWSRYLKLIAAGEKKTLIPCYKNLDAYDMPKEFARLQAQDMGKVGAMQDLIRGIDKIFGKDKSAEDTSASSQQVVIQQMLTGGANVDALLKRGYDALEDGAFDEAKGFFNDALNGNAESAEAYLGLFMSEIESRDRSEARQKYIAGDYNENRFWKRAKQYSKGDCSIVLTEWENGRNARLQCEADEERRRQEEEQRKLQEEEEKRVKAKKEKENDPAAQELKEHLASVRKKADLAESRVIADLSITLGLRENGEVVGTKVIDDEYNIFNNGKDKATGWKNMKAIYSPVADSHIIGLKNDGSVIVTRDRNGLLDGEDYEVRGSVISQWKNIKEMRMSLTGTVIGIKKDGTVLACDTKSHIEMIGKTDTSQLQNISGMVCTWPRNIFRKQDGTLAVAEEPPIPNIYFPWEEISSWTGIVSICKANTRWIGIKEDGTLVATKYHGKGSPDLPEEESYDYWNEIRDWFGIVMMENVGDRIIGLTEYGDVLSTKVIVPKNHEDVIDIPWENVLCWKEVAKLYVGYVGGIAAALLKDGEIVYTNYHGDREYYFGQDKLGKVSDAAGLILGFNRTVIIKKDGTLISVGENGQGQGNVSGIRLFENIDTFSLNFEHQKLLSEKRDAYNSYVEELNLKIEKELEIKTLPIKERYGNKKQPILNEIDQIINDNNKKKSGLEEKKRELERELSKLGLFKGKEKAEIKNQIAEVDSEIQEIESEHSVRQKFQPELSALQQQENEEIQQVENEVRSEYPIPPIEQFQI